MSDIEKTYAGEQTASAQPLDHIDLAASIVSAYVSKNSLPAAELPALLRSTYTTLASLSGTSAPPTADVATAEHLTPAQIRKSITSDALISFVDGKPYKTLKRHLSTHGLDPRAYRERYGLPSDYPMVAPSYAKQRSELAKSIGLGRPGGRLPKDEAPAEQPKPRGRRKAN